MSKDVKKGWHEEFYSEAELKMFADVGKGIAPEAMSAYQNRWAALIEEVRQNLGIDPVSEKAQDLGRRWTELLDEAYGGYPELKARIAKAYSARAIPKEYNMIAPEVWDFVNEVHVAAKKKRKK
jgi:hypothetical protein